MPTKSKDAEDFDNLKKLGFVFGSSSNESAIQPESGSLIGGERGRQEYGIVDETDLLEADRILDEDSLHLEGLPEINDDLSAGQITTERAADIAEANTGGVSEWSSSHADLSSSADSAPTLTVTRKRKLRNSL